MRHVLEMDRFSDIRVMLIVDRLSDLHPLHCGRFLGAFQHLEGLDIVVRRGSEDWIGVVDREVRRRKLMEHLPRVFSRTVGRHHDHCDHMRAIAAVTHFHLRQRR